MAALRAVLLLASLSLVASATAWPWALMWLAVPLVTASGLLLAWRFGTAAFVLPAVLAAGAALLVAFPVAGLRSWHLLWLPAAALTGAWMGSREEGGGPGLGERAWMHAPILAAALALPLLPGVPDAFARVEARAFTEVQQALGSIPGAVRPGSWQPLLEDWAKLPVAERVIYVTCIETNMVFLWIVSLVAAGRSLAARGAAWRGWPALSSAPVSGWRLPDGALVPLLAGLALALLPGSLWKPGAALLLTQSVLGYSVQGFAVAYSVLVARGMAPAFALPLLVILLVFTLLVSLPSVALLGLSDVWLDYRRLESSPRGEA